LAQGAGLFIGLFVVWACATLAGAWPPAITLGLGFEELLQLAFDAPHFCQDRRRGVDLGDFVTRPAEARLLDAPPDLWPRDPPIRYRAHIPTRWIALTLREGNNRQVRRMTARVGFPSLRLVRWRIGAVTLDDLGLGVEMPQTVNHPAMTP
jgi:hypothetical protein